MNRWDEIKATARNIATNVHTDPTARDVMADELIKLCGLMIGATGKVVAGEGERNMNDMYDEGDADATAPYRAVYAAGESMQSAADLVTAESQYADLERYSRPTPGDRCHCGHVELVHSGVACDGEQYNGDPCKDGPCTGFNAKHGDPVWVHVDRRPANC